MTTYKITIKDNSIPEHMQFDGLITEYTAIIECNNIFVINPSKEKYNDPHLLLEYDIEQYIISMATELDTDPESLEILSIIKQ